jgi:hypothetical protein
MFVLQRSKAVEAYLGTLRGVRFAVEGDEAGAFYIRAAGGKTAVAALENYLLETAKAAVSVEWPATAMGFQPSQAGMWAISSASGALVEAVGWTSYRATAGTVEAAEAAREIMLRAGARFKATEFAPALRALLPPHDPELETRFALIPHKPARVAPLLWSTEMAVAERPLFRLSRVEGRSESAGARDLRHRSADIADARVVPLGKGEASTLATVVDETLAKAALPDAARTLSFRLGHVLAPGANARPDGALSPPIEGAWALDEPTSPWLKLAKTVFGPAIPPALIRFPPAGAPRRFRRVTYAADGMRYVATYAFPVPDAPAVAESTRESKPWIVALDQQLKLAREQALARERGDDVPFDFGAIKGLIEEESKPEPVPLVVSATMGREAARDVVFPDRPVDARVVATSSHESTVPAELTAFFERVPATADAEIDLGDTAGLRRGKATAKPAAASREREEEEVFEGFEGWEEDDDVAFERAMGPPQVEVPAPEAPMPDIVPPRTLTVAGHEFALEADEVLELVESSIALAAHEGGREDQRAALRTVAAADLTGPGGVLRYGEVYAELPPSPESPVDPSIWRELANATREVAPSVHGTQFASI